MTATTIADRAVDRLAFLTGFGDPEHDELLEALVRGLLTPLERLSLAIYGDEIRDPLDVVLDPSRAELWSLEAAAEWTGGTLPGRRPGETDAAYLERARVAAARPRAIRRGSSDGLIEIGRPYLTGDQACRTVEDLDEGLVLFIVRTGSVDDAAVLEQVLNDPEVVAAGWRVEVTETDEPLIDEWTLTIDDVDVAIDDLTLEDVT